MPYSITNPDKGLQHIRPYFESKGQKYGMSKKEVNDLFTYDEDTKEVSFDGIKVDYPNVNINSKTYFNKSDLDSAWDEYVSVSGRTKSNKQRYNENADYISDEYKKLNSSLSENPFTSEYALEIYNRYMSLGKSASDKEIYDGRIDNNGSVDSSAWADAKRQEVAYKNAATDKIINYENARIDNSLKLLESFGKENQKSFENSQTEKLNDMKMLQTQSEITGEIPDEFKGDNPYIDSKTGNVFDTEIDYQDKIDQVKKDIHEEDDPNELERLNKTLNHLIDARTAKIMNNEEYMKYISEGDLAGYLENAQQKTDIRKSNTEKYLSDNEVIINENDNKTAMYESDKKLEGEKYTSDNMLKSDEYTADKKFEGDKYAADKELEGDKYTADKHLESDKYVADRNYDKGKYEANMSYKEKALEGLIEEDSPVILNSQSKDENPKETKSVKTLENGWVFPVNTGNYRISSGYGPRNTGIDGASTYHRAIDIACDGGTDVVAAKDGVVITSGWVNGYGNTVEISHGDNIITKYHHMKETPSVSKGDRVKAGQTIGHVGSTGISSGNHLDFQVYVNGSAVDPSKYIGK